ncbi:MAG: DUF2914 domain-containing protein [Alphaproteobacteria bacterium]|nr:DUF2914 domain-containing protein [Alphaproteobacteria bacterium]
MRPFSARLTASFCAALLCLALPAAKAWADEVKVVYGKDGKSKNVKKVKINAKKKKEPRLITITEVVEDNTLDALLHNGKGKKGKNQNTVKAVPVPPASSREVAPKEIYPEIAISQIAASSVPTASPAPEKSDNHEMATAMVVSLPGTASLPENVISLPENASAPADADMQMATVVTPASVLLSAPAEAVEKLSPIPPQIRCYYSLSREASHSVDAVDLQSADRLFFFSDIRGMKGKTLIHEWVQDGKTLYRVPLEIGQDAWRSWSSLPMKDAHKGTVTVLLKDVDDNLHAQKEIVIR